MSTHTHTLQNKKTMFIARSKQINTIKFCNKTITLFRVWAFVYENHCHSALVIKTYDRGGIATNTESTCYSTLVEAEHWCSSWWRQTQHLKAQEPGDLRIHSALHWQQMPFWSVVPDYIPKVYKKNRHSHSLTHKLRSYNFVAWTKWFTWTRWLRFSARADVRSLARISRVCCHPHTKRIVVHRVLNKANT